MTYPLQPGYKSVGTSSDAAESVGSRAATLRLRALECLKAHPQGLTADQCAELMNESILSVRPRFSELARRDFIETTGERRVNEVSGMQAWVWRIVKKEADE